MISLRIRAGDSAASFIHTVDVSAQTLIREYSTVLLYKGVTLLILTEPIRSFFFAVHCHQIDVVSGCGKNAEGAVQTLSLVFHNRSQKL